MTLLATLEVALQTAVLPFVVMLRAARALPWEIVVRDTGARPAASVVTAEHVRGWKASRTRMESLARDLARTYIDPDTPGFPVVLTRDPVCMGDDTLDNTQVLNLDDRTAEPTLATVLTAVQARGRFVSIDGAPTTWVLRQSSRRDKWGPPLAVLVLDPGMPRMDLHPVADLSFRVSRGSSFHLEYLLTQGVEQTLELIRNDPGRRRSLRASSQP